MGRPHRRHPDRHRQSNWGATLAEIRPNGHGRKPTPEEFDQIAADMERVTAERRVAMAAALANQEPEEELPY